MSPRAAIFCNFFKGTDNRNFLKTSKQSIHQAAPSSSPGSGGHFCSGRGNLLIRAGRCSSHGRSASSPRRDFHGARQGQHSLPARVRAERTESRKSQRCNYGDQGSELNALPGLSGFAGAALSLFVPEARHGGTIPGTSQRAPCTHISSFARSGAGRLPSTPSLSL